MNSDLRAGILKRASQVLAVVGLQAAILFLAAGRLDWLWGWAFVGLYLAGMAVNAVLLMRHNPQLVAERASAAGMKGWDRVVGGTFGILYFLGIPLVAGLNIRFGWTGQVAPVIHLTGALAFALGFALIIWSMVANAHFTTVVRVEADHDHAVCDVGPYRTVRHPGYVGALIQALAVPLILGSLWALIPGSLAALFMVLRTALEDRTLQDELPGYVEYTQKTHYRLVPGLW
jgi:protein-S-isoprenylcysteine O-methyltransferase Ste14